MKLNSGVYSAGAASWLLQNIVLNLTYTEIDNGSADALYNAVGGVYRVSTEGWRNYSTITSASRVERNIRSIFDASIQSPNLTASSSAFPPGRSLNGTDPDIPTSRNIVTDAIPWIIATPWITRS